MSLSFVIPTVGRPSLRRTLDSFVGDLQPQDEVIVVADGPSDYVLATVYEMRDTYPDTNWSYSYLPEPEGCWGQPARNHGFTRAQGTHWATIDDDDVYLPGAVASMRRAIDISPHLPCMFRARWGKGHPAHGVELWRRELVAYGEVATPMILAPSSHCRFGLEYGGDYVYAFQLQQHFGAFRWMPDVIAEIRPESAIQTVDAG